ncbi:MAG TPA: hypothetical protein DCS43_13195 [Verrucomicrobia bacterium]|nr:hypothetical protein [Verrucomicrobiota bacterium]
MGLSVIVITLNESSNIRRCLDSVAFADQIVVVDSGSSDDTVAIAREYTPDVFHREMSGFGEQKQFALDQATEDWILSLDADEWLSPELQASLTQFLAGTASCSPHAGYRIYRRNFYLGRPMTHCGWYIPLLRLIRRGAGRFNDKRVHEEIVSDGTAGDLHGDIMHVPYRDLRHHLKKVRHYAALDADELDRKGRKVYGWQAPIHLLLRPSYKFIEKYFIRQGWREGRHGLLLSAVAAWYVFLMHAQCWRLQRRRTIVGKPSD